MRYAASDVGSNSCRLLVAEVVGSDYKVLEKKIRTTRIGEGLKGTGWLKPEAIERTINCLAEFLESMYSWQVADKVIVATSAVRQAANREDFLMLASERLGVNVEVITGEKEGHLSYLGVKRSLSLKSSPLVVDIGGGSTEIAYQRRGRIDVASLGVGAVRATEEDWPREEIESRLAKGLDEGWKNLRAPLVLVGGTATSLVAVKKGLVTYEPEMVQGERLHYREICRILDELEAMSLKERRKVLGLQPERADIIVKGILIVISIMEFLGRESAVVSDSDLLDGLIWEMAEARL